GIAAGRSVHGTSGEISRRRAPRHRTDARAAAPPWRSTEPQGALHRAAQQRRGRARIRSGAHAKRMSVTVTTLASGLVVARDPMPHLESAAVGIWVNCGARHEAPAEMGLSHMLEHMAFKGTERRS